MDTTLLTQPLLLDLGVPTRVKALHVCFGLLVLSPALAFFVFQWNGTVGATVMLVLYCAGFGSLMIQGVQARIRVYRDYVRRRYLGIWLTKALPPSVEFAPVQDLTGNDTIARKLLKAPLAIGIFDRSSGREICRISYEFLAGMAPHDYAQLVESLNST